MTHIWNPALIAPFRVDIGAFEDQVTYVWASSAVLGVMQSVGVPLQTALPRACNVGQARAPAVAWTPARRFCATRPCTLCFLWATCREQFGLLFAQSVRRIVPQRMLDVRRGGCWHHGKRHGRTSSTSTVPLHCQGRLEAIPFIAKRPCVKLVLWLRCPPTPQREATRSRALREERPSSSRQVA